ncbi:hypothetical protein HNR19_003129 [Nocardioides thalensis]|uniref:Uncharacterized protein n=1 Tax=Nocardioides thalensis TaxID=1914755 RepID=A0A853C5J8_9ACTN|nr:hypothetical protein [Nocardioides thalensis]NYJ02431.1 hypothetical protein [Nocardioides thalensis]
MTKTFERMLPLYEAKMLDAYDHRDADVFKSATAGKRQNQPRYLTDEEKRDRSREAMPIAWVRESVLPEDLPDWLTGFSDVTSATNERTVLAAAFPRAGVGHTYPLWFGQRRELLLAVLNSHVLDYLARQKVAGLHLTYGYVRQFPVPTPDTFEAWCPWSLGTLADWLTERVVRLSVTSHSMVRMASELVGAQHPYAWKASERDLLRAEIDAAMFHLYAVSREDVDYIMDTFPIVKRKDEVAHGEYRTKRLILETYDQMAEAIASGTPYSSPFDED